MAKKSKKEDGIPPPENNTSRHLPAKVVPVVKKLKGRRNPIQDEPEWNNGRPFEPGEEGYIKAEPNMVGDEERNLKCELTQEELSQGAGKLAGLNNKLTAIESEKKSVMAEYTSKIQSCKSDIGVMAGILANGYEMRRIHCTVVYHQPEDGKKTIRRKDNNFEWIEVMDASDWNLFNQPGAPKKSFNDKKDFINDLDDLMP